MKKLLISLILSIAPTALADSIEVPPPGTSRNGPIEVTPAGKPTSTYNLRTHKVIPRAKARAFNMSEKAKREALQDEIERLRERIAELESEPAPVARALPKAAPAQRTESRSHRIYALAGVMPDGVHVDNGDRSREATIHEHGFAVGAGYAYKFDNQVSIGGAATVTTRDTHLTSFYGTLGYDFDL